MADRPPTLWNRIFGAKAPAGRSSTTLGEGVVIDGRFAIRRLLGIGGSSAVYVAEQISMGREVALKILRSELLGREAMVQRFLREVRAVSRLTSPHTIAVYDVGITGDGHAFIAMELLKGESLYQAMVRENGPFDPVRAAHLISQCCESLAEAHSVGVLHRDLKPENLFLVASPTSREFVKVLDFGIAQLGDEADAREEPRGVVVGTASYMSPEQMLGQPLDPRSDLYSLATILYELVAGCLPFDAPTPRELGVLKTTRDAPPVRRRNPSRAIPPELEMFLARALSRSPGDRPADAREFRNLLRMAVEGLSGEDDEAETPGPGAPRDRKDPGTGPQGDRRKFQRRPRIVKVRFLSEGKEYRATSVDTSGGGAFLASRHLPPVGAMIEVLVDGGLEGRAVARTQGEVVRVVETPSGPTGVRGFAVRWKAPEAAGAPVSVDDLVRLIQE
ncbi:protein kinase [Myxococcota bacterium]|jgi:serine/threonine-protein kinase|nr:protein kinase [Myxococcota bacterium]